MGLSSQRAASRLAELRISGLVTREGVPGKYIYDADGRIHDVSDIRAEDVKEPVVNAAATDAEEDGEAQAIPTGETEVSPTPPDVVLEPSEDDAEPVILQTPGEMAGRPETFSVGLYRVRVARGPDDHGQWYWRAENHRDRQTIWTGWATAADAREHTLEAIAESTDSTTTVQMISYTFQLRPGFFLDFQIPADLTHEDVERLSRFFGALPFS